MIHVPQQIHIEYTVENGRLTQRVLDLLNAIMLRNDPHVREQDRILGLFADQADLLDQVTESAMQSRETDPLRVP